MSGRPLRIAVTGATGTVGQFTVEALAAGGYQVVALVRPESDIGVLPAETEIRPFRLDPHFDFGEALAGVDGLVHSALHHAPGRFRGGEGDDLAGFILANVDGSLALLSAAKRAGVKRCVVLSSRAIYGRQPAGVLLTEDMATHPDTHYGAVKAALEGFVSSFGLGEGWPVAALRPTGIYGVIRPVERSKWFELVRSLLRGEEIPVRGGTEVHGGDVAAAIMRLIEALPEMIAGRMFNCSDLFVSSRDIAMMVAEISGRDVRAPEPAEPGATNLMDCSALRSVGVQFGGAERLRETIKALVEAAA